jgi:hypothetical protein
MLLSKENADSGNWFMHLKSRSSVVGTKENP